MPTEIDSLSIGISASSRNAEQAIDRLIGRMKNLDTAFRSLSGSTTYAKNLETATHALTRVNNAVANFQASKIADVAKSLKSLSSAAKSLSSFGDMSALSNSMRGVSSNAKNMADSIAKSFNIKDKDAINDLTRSIQTMQQNVGKGDAYYDAEAHVESLIREYSKFDNKIAEVSDSYKILREYLNDNTIYIPKGASAEQNYKQNRGRIGIKNTTSDPTKGIGIEQVQRELSAMIPELKGMINPQDIFGSLADYLQSVATPAMVGFDESVAQGSDASQRLASTMEQLQSSMGVVIPNAEQIQTAMDSVDFSKFADISDYMVATDEAVRRMRDSLQGVSQSMQNVASSFSQTSEQTQPFQNIVSGLESLQGVNIGDFSNISVLADGVNKLGYQSAVTASQILPQLSQGLRSFSGVTLPTLDGMEGFAQGLRSLGSKAVQNAAYSLPFVADGLRQLKSIGDLPDMKGLNEFAQALSIFGRKTSTTAVTNIPKLAQSFQQLFSAMTKAPTISRNTIDAANAFANLAARSGSVNSALTKVTPKLSLWSATANKAKGHTLSLASAIGKLYATYWLMFRAFSKIGDAINIASDLTEVRNVVTQAFDDMAYKANEFADMAGESFGMSKLESLGAASRYQAMGKTMGITDAQVIKANSLLKEKLSDTFALKEVQQAYGDLGDTAADMSINLTKLAGDLASLYNVDIAEATEKMNSIFTGTTRPLREFGFDLTQATLKEWALTQGINANISEMTQAEKAVLRYQYVMANAGFVMGDFVRTADSWHNTIVRLKLAFKNLGSVIGQGFINLLKPAVQKITAFVNTLTGLIQKAINAIGKLLGWQIEIDPVAADTSALEDASGAADNMEDATGGTADNMSDAAKSAKKMKDYLLGIDELNVFKPDEDSSSSGSGSGSGSGSSGGSSSGGAKGGDVSFKKYESDISSWFQLGKKIGDALADALESIDWDKIYKKAEHFGTGLASFLNGLISPRLFYDLGMTIANALNTALHFLNSFGEHFDWKNFGESIAAGINGFFENFDFALLAQTFNTWALGLLDALITALKKTKWEMIGEKIGTFLKNVKWLEIGKKVAQAIWAAINAAFKLYKGMFKTAPLETAILSVVAAFGLFNKLKTLDWFKNLAKVVGIFNTELAAGNGILGATNVAFPLLGSFLTRIGQLFTIGSTSVGVFSTALTNGMGIMGSMQAGFGTLVAGVNAFAASLSPLATLIGGAFGAFVEFFTVSDGVQNLITGAQNLKSAIAEIAVGVGIAGAAFTLVFGFPAGLIAAAVVGVIAAIKGINDAFKQIETETFGNQVKNALINPGGTPLEDIIGLARTQLDNMGDGFSDLAAQSENLGSVNGNIKSIGNEIDVLNLQLQNGVITQEEYTTQIADAYDKLSQAINTKLSDAETYIVSAFAEGSPINEALKANGVQVDQLANDTIQSAGEIKVRMSELVSELQGLDPTNPRYAEAQKELMDLASGTDETAKSTQALQTATSKNIDWESFIDSDGALKVGSISGILGEVADKAEDVKTNAETSLNGVVTAMEDAGNKVGADEVRNAIPDALDSINSDVAEQCTKMSDTIQQDAINHITDIITQAGSDWEKMDDWQKAVYYYNEDAYIKEAVNSYKTNVIDPLSSEINTEYGNLGIEGAGWASDAADEIIQGMFSSENIPGHAEAYSTILNTNWQDTINKAATATYDTAVENGKYVYGGIIEGAKEVDVDEGSGNFFTRIWNSITSKFGIGSPAKAMYPLGNYIMQGIVEGFKEKYADITTAISNWFTKYVQPWFTIAKWQQLGNNIKTAIVTKWDEFKNQWVTKITTWWNSNVLPWFNLAKWKTEADHIRDAIITKFNEMVLQWITNITTWWNQNVVPWLDLTKWKTEADHIRDAIITKFNEMVSEWSTAISNWWENHVKPWFSLEKWKELASSIKNAILGAIDDVIKEWGAKIQSLVDKFKEIFKADTFKSIGEDAINNLVSGFESKWVAIKSRVEAIGNAIKQIFQGALDLWNDLQNKSNSTSTSTSSSSSSSKKKAKGGVFSGGRWHNVTAYASGGMPDSAQLFMAREAGPELVGTIGSNTAVVNNEQIVASVAAGVQSAVTQALSPYLSEITTNTRITANKDLTLNIGDRQIAEANNRGQRALGAVLLT